MLLSWLRGVTQDAKHLQRVEAPKQTVTRVNLTGFTARQLAILSKLANGEIDDLSGDFFITGEFQNGEATDDAA